MINRKSKLFHLLSLILTNLILFSLVFVQVTTASTNKSIIQDEKFLFEIKIPSDWHLKQSSIDTSYWRLTATSPEKNVYIDVYAGRTKKGFIDLVKLVDIGKKDFTFLGDEVERRKIGFNKYEVLYNNKNKYNEYAKAIYLVKENNYYILISYSNNNDLREGEAIFKTFQIKIPFSWYAIIFIIGTISMLLHLFLIHYFAIIFTKNNIGKDDIKNIFLKWNFLWTIPLFLLVTYFIFYKIDFILVRDIIVSFNQFGIDGLIYHLIDIGPAFYELAGEFISEAMSEIIGIGFWPGGRAGIIASTAVSIIANIIELYYLSKYRNESTPKKWKKHDLSRRQQTKR